jgi:hypothetical protein
MPATGKERDLVPIHTTEYDYEADLDVDHSGAESTVENHDELVKSGLTTEKVRMVDRETALEYDLDVIDINDSWWDDRFLDAEKGQTWPLDEFRD